mgnify:CR=1 FL=1
MICFGCSAKIPYSEIYKKRRMAAISQCSRFLWMFSCNKCNKTFNYLSFQKHKELFKITLIAINGGAEEVAKLLALRDAKEAARLQALRDAEEAATRLQALRDAEEAVRLQALQACRSFSSNVSMSCLSGLRPSTSGQCYSLENLNGISGFSQSGGRGVVPHNFYGHVSRF